MRPALKALAEEYAQGLREYLQEGGEAPLFKAYQIGRSAVRSGVGVLEVSAAHQQALVEDVLRMLGPKASATVARRASEFFAEALAAFEANRRGFLEANTLLREANSELEGRIAKALHDQQETRTELEEQRRLDALKEEFVSMVSHELRTPLTSIHAALGVLAAKFREAMPSGGQQLLDVALRNSQRLARLVDNVLDLQKAEAGSLTFDVRSLDLAALLRIAAETNQPYAARFDVTLSVGEVPAHARIRADADRVLQVLTNLLSNAVKHSPSGGTVVVSAELAPGTVRVRVVDRGAGIPENFRDRVFQRFAQADSSSTRLHGGSGLGLSISKAIVERLGGTIAFDTGAGGTTFFFDLPIADDLEEPCLEAR
jgi:signal transduction histidine kinase